MPAAGGSGTKTVQQGPADFDAAVSVDQSTVYNHSIQSDGDSKYQMKANYSIAEIEQAINYWTRRQAADSHWALCPSARVLADVYGAMIYRHDTSVSADGLNAAQSQAIETALHQMELGLAP